MSQQFVTYSGTGASPRLREVDVAVPSEPGFIYSRHISWASILAGATVGAAIQLGLTVLGTGLGLLAFGHYAERTTSEATLSIGAGLWLLVSSLISLFVGGAIAARGARVTPCMDGVIHGLAVWSLVTLLSVSVLGTSAAVLMGGLFSGLTRFIPDATQAASTVTAAAIHTPRADGIANTGRAFDAGTTVGGSGGIGRTDTELRDQPNAGADGSTVGGPTGIGRSAADTTARDARDRQAAGDLGRAAIFAFFGLLLGAVAACLGGSIGRHMFQRYDATGAVPVPATGAAVR